jgi:hypothetical protein
VPIALLPELTATLARAGKVLAPWSRMVSLEETILMRARGAFLVHWFGRTVPVQGLSLHIAIRNIAELKRRYLEVNRSMPGAPPELNLLGPLAGIAGFLFGAAVSPTGAILIATQMHRIMDALVGGWGGGILATLYRIIGIWILPALGPALGILVLPLLLGGALVAALGGDRLSQGIYLALGELAVLLDVVLRFWDQITGPRSGVRNPLVRRILDLFDRIAGLFVQVIGFAALLVTRFARLLPHVMSQFRAFQGLVEAIVAALVDIFRDFGARLAAPFTEGEGLVMVLVHVFKSLVRLPELMMEGVSELVGDAITELTHAFGAISTMIETFVDELKGNIVTAFGETVVGTMVTRIQALLKRLPAIADAFANPPEAPAGSGDDGGSSWAGRNLGDPLLYTITGGLLGSLWGVFDGSLGQLLGAIDEVAVPGFPELEIPSFPDSPTLPDLSEIMTRIGEPSGLDAGALTARLDAEASAALAAREIPPELLRDPTSAFALERRDLERTMGRPALQLDDERLRDLIYLAVGRVLPAALRIHAPDVRDAFDRLDEEVYREEREPLARPMLDLGDSGRLRPIVERLTVRSKGGFAPDVRAFRDLLVEELEGRTYLAPAAP